MLRRGFTVVEIIITITIMGILLTLAVVSLTSSQVNSRDTERKGDIEALATHLETFYRNGSDTSPNPGRYPSTAITSNETALRNALRDIDIKSVIAPGSAGMSATLAPATNATQTTTGVAPQPTITQYVYQPLQSNNTLCSNETQECRKFNIYYRLEADNTVYMVTSKNQ
jgi:prepilin-type N-terminal cleavage/methylation domain-containing protein